MRINWKIEKKRGNFRPSLKYTMVLEEHERELAVDAVQVKSGLPCLENPHQEFCLPGTHERTPGWVPTDFHWLSVPFFRDGEKGGTIRLPFRESGEYPEVKEAFLKLQEGYEQLVREAYDWAPIKEQGELDATLETKQAIAATLVSRKLALLSESYG